MSERTGTPFEAGVDWITVTALTPHNARRLEIRGGRLLREQKHLGEEEHLWGMSGFTGKMCGGVQLGFRDQSVLCRLTSDTAHDKWNVVHEVSDNCSRIDVQVTVRYEVDVQQIIHQHYKEALRHSRSLKRGPKVSVWSSSDDSSTLYLGDRTSDVFGRCYNKGKESNMDHYQKTLRFEAEVKDERARLLARELAAQPDPQRWMLAYVHGFFSKRGCRLTWHCDTTIRLCRPRARSTAQKRLAWLEANVRSSVEWLCQRGYEAETLRALGLVHATPNIGRGSTSLDVSEEIH